MRIDNEQKLCILLIIGCLSSSIKLHAPKRDAKFWNIDRILLGEPTGQWPNDAVNCLYVDNNDIVDGGKPNWNYWYRRDGMQTSTDDVIVALIAAYPEIKAVKINGTSSLDLSSLTRSETKATESAINTYVDLGCGIGSTLLLVANVLHPKKISLGVEAQEQSASLLRRTIFELPVGVPYISVIHRDLRELPELNSKTNPDRSEGVGVKEIDFESDSHDLKPDNQIDSIKQNQLNGRCDLITANPPYAPLQSGTLCKDAQRRSARFELRGGVEDYLIVAKSLLAPEGRFILAFWSRDHERIRKAVRSAELRITRRFDVLMGQSGRTLPHLSVYDIRPIHHTSSEFESDSTKNSSSSPRGESDPNSSSGSRSSNDESEVFQLDITRDPISGGLSENYELIKKLLKCANRPLKPKRSRNSS